MIEESRKSLRTQMLSAFKPPRPCASRKQRLRGWGPGSFLTTAPGLQAIRLKTKTCISHRGVEAASTPGNVPVPGSTPAWWHAITG